MACCKAGLDRPLIPTAFVANLFRWARVSRPRRSTDSFGEGLQTPPFGRLVRRGSPDPAVRRPWVSRWRAYGRRWRSQSKGGSGDRARTSLEAQAQGRRDGTIRSPATYPTRSTERPSSEVWCQPAGARKSRGRMLLSGLGRARPPTICLPIRVSVARARSECSLGPRR